MSHSQISAEAQEARDGNSAPHLSACPKVVKVCHYVAQMKAYSGKVIFCRLVKKSLLRIVEAESILPDRLVTTLVTSSGNAMPSARSTRFSGFKASMPSASNSFSNVFITDKIHKYIKHLTLETRKLPGRLFTKASKV
jgi:hypothetical protein